MPVAEPILSLQGLRKSYGALKVTDGVDLEIMPGELHAVIGPNGAGKTSLVHQICGTLRSDAGRILFEGADIIGLAVHQRARLGLARSFQITQIVPGFTVLDNVALAVQGRARSTFRFFRPAAGDPALEGPAMEALRVVDLAGRADLPAGLLSHGEKRSLELAIALAQSPKLLVLDEPMAGTGPEETARLIDILSRLKGRLAILLVEHDMHAVFALADRVTVLVYGRVIASGPPDAVRADAGVREAYLGDEAEAA